MPTDAKTLASFTRDEGGAVAVVVALLLTVLLGFVALGVDVASLYRERASLQADSDMVAMSAMTDTDAATDRALYALGQNGRHSEALATLTVGRFLRNPEVPRGERFTPLAPGTPGINAVAVTLKDAAPLHFAKIFTPQSKVALTRNATAIRTGAASFSLDSNILRLDLADLNAALSDSFGTSVTLSVLDMDILSRTSVNMGDLLTEVSSLMGSTARNPAAILDARTDVGTVITAIRNMLPPAASGSLDSIAAGAGLREIPLAAVIGGIDSALGLTAVEFASHIDISALDVVAALAVSHDYTHPVSGAADVAISGVLSTTTQLAAGEPPARSGWVALGEKGVQLHRAALRLKTDVAFTPDLLGGLGAGVSVTRLDLPVYVEGAGATATLEEINCTYGDADATAARFSTAPTPLNPENGTSVAALYLGKLDDAAFNSGPIAPSDLDFADILDLSLRIDLPLLPDIVIDGITVQARSHVALGASQVETISFSMDDVRSNRTTRGFSSGDLQTTGIASLLSPDRTEIRIKPGQEGLITGAAAILVETALAALPNRLLTGLTGPLDAAVGSALDSAGLHLGEGALTLTGHHCELVRLVQ
ncbi:TadG family pilus assembly protein [Roseobacter sp. GAI101]|uniref:TadG family pilus assembly protein n=1 Tax=Roseobacter sp. (strain GAI101) TaxID=391589 RepID=UPI0002DC1A4E|nr:TadG family pilus assembly protein [Roseobacter sp. GAI101]